jgi:xanthosine phosphorylase
MTDLFDAALAAYRNAHAPYSGFAVGAALRTASGRIFAGANVENAAFPEGNCAEASAIAAMVTAGERRIAELLVIAGGERLCTPCGGCRQRLAEFADPDLPIRLCSPEGPRESTTLGALLPLAFDLGSDQAGETTTGPEGAPTLADPERLVARIRTSAPDAAPRTGIILGSGLGGFADLIEPAESFAYEDLPGFPRPSVEGHSGRLILGTIEGWPVACLQGRVHLYEGLSAGRVNLPLRVLKGLGCRTLIVTNAAGSLRADMGPGSIALIEDHINMLGQNPLVGPNDAGYGPRFLDLSGAYDRGWRQRLQKVAARLRIDLRTGVYLATLGPSFETPAEIRAFRTLGADLVGMSTVPEVIAARHLGLKVAGLSIVTNLAAGLATEPLSHYQTLAHAEAAGADLQRLLQGVFKELAEHDSEPASQSA